jgi:hypothetical protein
MERNKEEEEEEKQASYADAIEDYLDSFQSMQKATENEFGDNKIAEAMDDDLESLLMLSKMPAAVPASIKGQDIAKEKSMEKSTKESSMEIATQENSIDKSMEKSPRKKAMKR